MDNRPYTNSMALPNTSLAEMQAKLEADTKARWARQQEIEAACLEQGFVVGSVCMLKCGGHSMVVAGHTEHYSDLGNSLRPGVTCAWQTHDGIPQSCSYALDVLELQPVRPLREDF